MPRWTGRFPPKPRANVFDQMVNPQLAKLLHLIAHPGNDEEGDVCLQPLKVIPQMQMPQVVAANHEGKMPVRIFSLQSTHQVCRVAASAGIVQPYFHAGLQDLADEPEPLFKG